MNKNPEPCRTEHKTHVTISVFSVSKGGNFSIHSPFDLFRGHGDIKRRREREILLESKKQRSLKRHEHSCGVALLQNNFLWCWVSRRVHCFLLLLLQVANVTYASRVITFRTLYKYITTTFRNPHKCITTYSQIYRTFNNDKRWIKQREQLFFIRCLMNILRLSITNFSLRKLYRRHRVRKYYTMLTFPIVTVTSQWGW